jgi:uncharacterized protein YneF (UPF0154 family)
MNETLMYVEGMILGVLHGILIGYMLGRRSKKK